MISVVATKRKTFSVLGCSRPWPPCSCLCLRRTRPVRPKLAVRSTRPWQTSGKSRGKGPPRDCQRDTAFPKVYKAGSVVGGECADGALRVGGKALDYYSTAAASFGFQLGAQAKSIVSLFMEKSALQKFRASEGGKVGVGGSVSLVDIGVHQTRQEVTASNTDRPGI